MVLLSLRLDLFFDDEGTKESTLAYLFILFSWLEIFLPGISLRAAPSAMEPYLFRVIRVSCG